MKLSKSKLALAKVINENGGWRDDSGGEFAAQCTDGIISFWCSKPSKSKGEEWCGYGYTGSKYEIKNLPMMKNWHQCVLSREEYYQAYPEADDGWVEWNGVAKSPVGKGVAVDVKMKNGTQHFGLLIDDECWGDHWGDASIIAYRLHKPEAKPEFCESVMRSIPEPESHEKLSPEAIEDAKFALMSESIEESKRKPTIEQLAQDYRNAKDYAERKQQEADDAKAAADAALGELERAGDALGLLIGIAKPDQEPELVITDWRDLQVGDEIECVGYGHPHTIGVVERFDEISVDQNIFVRHQNGDVSWPRLWNFIRRP